MPCTESSRSEVRSRQKKISPITFRTYPELGTHHLYRRAELISAYIALAPVGPFFFLPEFNLIAENLGNYVSGFT
ncbi:hypothetical protein J6590_046870 [Homalodisca vitripennis]|nr:hypothetical protein J6590_046870 [Homalodisca vitripennis]